MALTENVVAAETVVADQDLAAAAAVVAADSVAVAIVTKFDSRLKKKASISGAFFFAHIYAFAQKEYTYNKLLNRSIIH